MLVSTNTKMRNPNTSQWKPQHESVETTTRVSGNHNTSQWNIGCIGSPGVGAHVGHVLFMLFVSISLALSSKWKCSFQWNMGFRFDEFI